MQNKRNDTDKYLNNLSFTQIDINNKQIGPNIGEYLTLDVMSLLIHQASEFFSVLLLSGLYANHSL